MCKINNILTHYCIEEKSESYEKSANTHSTTLCMYISICIHEIQNYAFASP